MSTEFEIVRKRAGLLHSRLTTDNKNVPHISKSEVKRFRKLLP